MLALDVMRPAHRWLAGQRFAFWKALSHYRDHVHTVELEQALIDAKASPALANNRILTLGRIQAHTGKSIRRLTAEDILADHPAARTDDQPEPERAVWPVLHGLGWISHKSQAMPSRRRVGQRTVEEMVDYYNVTGRAGNRSFTTCKSGRRAGTTPRSTVWPGAWSASSSPTSSSATPARPVLRAQIKVGGVAVRFTRHDFRRISA
jgi:hypothetical protein